MAICGVHWCTPCSDTPKRSTAPQRHLGSRTHDQHLGPLRQKNTAGEEQGLSIRANSRNCFTRFHRCFLTRINWIHQLRPVPQACAWGTDCTKFTCHTSALGTCILSAPGPVNFCPRTLLYMVAHDVMISCIWDTGKGQNPNLPLHRPLPFEFCNTTCDNMWHVFSCVEKLGVLV